MGTVYLARSPGGRKVAVKLIRADFATDTEFRRRFAREVTAVRAVSGAYTAPVIDADTECATPWLATAFVPGPSLWQAVRSEGVLSAEHVRELGAGLAEALVNIHAAGVVHRDLKPQNVLLGDDGPRVIDFGIARIDGSTAITQDGVYIGTPEFMSPEQFTRRQIDGAGDVFSLGSVLTFAATSLSPFGPGTSEQAMYRIVHEEPRLDAVPAELVGLIRSCLAKRPESRPSPTDLLDWLGGRAATRVDTGRPGNTLPLGPPPPPPAPEEERWPAPTLRDPAQALSGGGSSLVPNAQALLAAGLTDELVIEAARRDRRY
jgi:serine/threonine protein kinase